MKKSLFVSSIALAALTFAGCQDQSPKVAQNENTPATVQPAAASADQAAAKNGNVVETMDAGGYTYVKVDTGSETLWAAAPQFSVKVGDPVVIPQGMPMKNFHSKTLERDFDLIYFVDSVLVGGESAAAAKAMPEGHPTIDTAKASESVDLSDVKPAESGKTVETLYSGKDELAGKEVTLRGKVVKFSPQIMGKNWIHIQDGTGEEGNNDLTVTTDSTAQIGDTVLVTGVLTKDKDFGYGYQYPLIIEDAKIEVEN